MASLRVPSCLHLRDGDPSERSVQPHHLHVEDGADERAEYQRLQTHLQWEEESGGSGCGDSAELRGRHQSVQ